MHNYADNSDATGDQIHDLVSRLFPICRSQTGDGVRQSLQMLRELIPLDLREVPSGINVFDWEVPQEWNISNAWIADEDGNHIVDFSDSNLHVVNGSAAVQTTLPWSELKEKLTTLPDQPDLIPYRASFFGNSWGFCLSQRKFDELERRGERRYEVCIDASRVDGSLTYGELLIPGASDAEVLLSTHTCHPSLANDGLTGMAIAAFLGEWLAQQERQYSYRLLFAPATIGAITWLSLNEDNVKNIRHGLVLSCLGDSGHLNYRRSRRDTAEIDRTVVEVLGETCDDFAVHRFEPFGYDQRQFCSPGFDLPMGCLMRTPNGEYPQYHTSADDLNLVRPAALQHSFTTITQIIERLEQNYSPTYLNVNPKCEPRLGKHGLYHAFGARPNAQEIQQAILWVLNLSDGHRSLVDIAHRSAVPIKVLTEASKLLEEHGFLTCVCGPGPSENDSGALSSPTREIQMIP